MQYCLKTAVSHLSPGDNENGMLNIEEGSLLEILINELTNDELSELAKDTAKNDLVDISLFLRGGFTISSVSNITETWLRISQMPYRCETNGDSCKIIIEHDMGLKYSYLIQEISRYLLEVAFEAKSSCDITENTLS
jgi:hypothetical protein